MTLSRVPPPMRKRCSTCKVVKSLSEFYKRSSAKDSLRGTCKMCKDIAQKKYNQSEKGKAQKKKWTEDHREEKRDYNKKYREKNRDTMIASSKKWHKDNPEGRRRNHLQRLYGLTLADYDRMYVKQNRCCAICGKFVKHDGCSRIFVDHNHITGQVRGLLCRHCNTSLGHFKADEGPKLLLKAIEYIKV